MLRVIVDVDCGFDEAYLLLVLIAAQIKGLIQIEAIVCTFGCTSLINVCLNVKRVLNHIGAWNIPMYRGASGPLLPHIKPLTHNDGKNGFGDRFFPLGHDLDMEEELAVIAMHEIVTQNPGEISLLCTGPLTTAALAIQIFDDFAGNLDYFYISGGSYEDHSTEASFNFVADPEAADFVLNTSAIPDIILVPWELILTNNHITLDWRLRLGMRIQTQTSFMLLMKYAEDPILIRRMPNPKYGTYYLLRDTTAGMVMVFPHIVEAKFSVKVSIELRDFLRRGVMHLHLPPSNDTGNVTLLHRIHWPFIRGILYRMISNFGRRD